MYKIKNIVLMLIPTGLVFGSFNTQPSTYMPTIFPVLSDKSLLNYDKNVSEIISSEKIERHKVYIIAEKSKYRLTVYYERKPIKSYPFVLGSNPVDDKLKDGDDCTPEGKFKIKSSYKHPRWNKFIWLNYPTIESWKKYTSAKSKGILKITDSIGSKFGIRGVTNNNDDLITQKNNWTNGDISLKNKDIDEIFSVVEDGTTIEIVH